LVTFCPYFRHWYPSFTTCKFNGTVS